MPYKPKKSRLLDIELDEVSLVDVPANPKAKAVFYKRAGAHVDCPDVRGTDAGEIEKSSEGEIDMDIEELQARLTELENGSAELEKRAKDAEAKVNGFMKSAADAGFEVSETDSGFKIEKSAEEEMIEFNGERIAKSSIPAPLLKHLNEQKAEMDAIKKKAEIQELHKRAEETFPNLGGTVAQKASLIKSLDSIDSKEDREAVMKSLKAADAAVSKMFEETGDSSAAHENSAEAQLEKMATEYAEAHNVDRFTAFAEVTKTAAGKQLVIKSREEKLA